jgi:hypothetical protein
LDQLEATLLFVTVLLMLGMTLHEDMYTLPLTASLLQQELTLKFLAQLRLVLALHYPS